LLIITGWAASGCAPAPDHFRLNRIYLAVQENAARNDLTVRQEQDLADVLEYWFGTPQEPRLPALDGVEIASLIDLDKLRRAAGPVRSDQAGTPFGLYREHCAPCHGIEGDGAGPTAVFLNPYPRDFRRGVFKFKSTAGVTTPPTDEDLRGILVRGMPGTSMPSFRLLADDELDALVHYVKYLAIRGAVERSLMLEAVDVLGGPEDRLIEVPEEALAPIPTDSGHEPGQGLAGVFVPSPALGRQLDDLQPLVAFVVQAWAEASQRAVPAPPRPANWGQLDSIRRGQQLYFGDVANCVKCHGEQYAGDGQTQDYDDWTKEILDPQRPESVRPYLALGALKPRTVRPRDLTKGMFHGGSNPEDLYLRIHNGIAGTPMPAAPMKPAEAKPNDIRLTSDDVWHLVDFVLHWNEAPPIEVAVGKP
jgi:mono/diheme cytochrome c family protein